MTGVQTCALPIFPSLTPVAIAALTLQYREHPGWTAQLHLDKLRVACKAVSLRQGCLISAEVMS